MIVCPDLTIWTVILPGESGILSLLTPALTLNDWVEPPHFKITVAGAVANTAAHIVSCGHRWINHVKYKERKAVSPESSPSLLAFQGHRLKHMHLQDVAAPRNRSHLAVYFEIANSDWWSHQKGCSSDVTYGDRWVSASFECRDVVGRQVKPRCVREVISPGGAGWLTAFNRSKATDKIELSLNVNGKESRKIILVWFAEVIPIGHLVSGPIKNQCKTRVCTM